MREIRLSGLEGGGAELNRLSLPLSKIVTILLAERSRQISPAHFLHFRTRSKILRWWNSR